MALQGLAFFPGVERIISATYTRSHSITPGVATLEIVPQLNFTATQGTLEFRFGAVRLLFPDCRVDLHSLRLDQGGRVWALSILDRRWKWVFGDTSGHFNWRSPEGFPLRGLERTPRQLATRALDAMRETGYDVSQVPDDTRPFVDWEAANPAQVLAELCEQLGCRIALRLDNKVALVRLGFGAELPLDGTVISDSLAINPPEKPDAIDLVAGKTRWQTDFLLEAVGLELNDSLRRIDDLSYKPKAGWSAVDIPAFSMVAAGKARELAKETVFRWYRIRTDLSVGGRPGIFVPGFGNLRFRDQFLPIEDEQVETLVANDGEVINKPAEVFGTFWDGGLAMENVVNQLYKRDFNIVTDQGLIEFSERVIQYDANQKKSPAALRLRCAFSIRDPDNWEFVRFRRTRPQEPKSGTEPRVLKHDEIHNTVFPRWDAQFRLLGLVTNDDKIIPEADHYLIAAEREYQTTLPREVVYAGLRPIDLDGAIHEVTWSVGPQGATTTASRNNEFSLAKPSYKERRAMEILRHDRILQLQKRLDAMGRRERGRHAPAG